MAESMPSQGTENSVGLIKQHFYTFGSEAEPFVLENRQTLSEVTTCYERYGTLNAERDRYERHFEPTLAEKPFSYIERQDVGKLRDDIAKASGGIESNRCVALFNRIANHAVNEGWVKFNPANRLPKVGKEKSRERHLDEAELRAVWTELNKPLVVGTTDGLTDADQRDAVTNRCALKLCLLLGQRRGEVIGIPRSEIGLDGVWEMPGGLGKDRRTKNDVAHRVPLPPLATAVVNAALQNGGTSVPWYTPATATVGF